jgi:hypothetical protein
VGQLVARGGMRTEGLWLLDDLVQGADVKEFDPPPPEHTPAVPLVSSPRPHAGRAVKEIAEEYANSLFEFALVN